MVSIPTPIPEYLADRVGSFFNAGLALIVYRSLLVVVGLVLIIAALQSFGIFVGTLIGILLSVVLSDDIRATVKDIWNLNFWVFRT